MGFVTTLSQLVGIPEWLLGHAVVVLITFVVSSGFLLWRRIDPEGHDASEPPVARTSIPIIGHILGMRKYNIRYLEMLRLKAPGPAYTMKVLWNKTYVIVSPSLSHAALRSKALSLEPLSARLSGAMLGISRHAIRNLGLADDGHWVGSPAMVERRVDLNQRLAPGSELSLVTKAAGKELAKIVNDFGTEWVEKDLYMWLRDNVTFATLLALYGPLSPMAVDRSLIDDVWKFDENQLALSVSKFPFLTAREGMKARKRLAEGFENYLRSDNQRFASNAVKKTIEIITKNNLSLEDSARLEIFNTSVATVNTVPTAVWMLLNILANDDLLQALREELGPAMKITPTSKGRDVHLDLTNITESCPLLHATYQEALRLGSIPTCNRSVLEDTVLKDSETGREFTLKKGHRVVIPTFMLHFRDSFWNENAREFDPQRFMKTTQADSKEKKLRNTAFVPYGGGIHLCPGRHLAQAEILAVAGLMIAALDFQLSDGGKITVPQEAAESGSKKPAVPIIVGIRRRAGWENVTWSVES